MKPIILRTRTSTDECIGTVRLTPEAEKVVRRLRFKTGLPIRQIVSEIIVQAENLIDISGDDDEDETDQRGGPGMKTQRDLEYINNLKLEANSAKDKLMAIEDSLREVGANREANSLSTIIARLEAWQNK